MCGGQWKSENRLRTNFAPLPRKSRTMFLYGRGSQKRQFHLENFLQPLPQISSGRPLGKDNYLASAVKHGLLILLDFLISCFLFLVSCLFQCPNTPIRQPLMFTGLSQRNHWALGDVQCLRCVVQCSRHIAQWFLVYTPTLNATRTPMPKPLGLHVLTPQDNSFVSFSQSTSTMPLFGGYVGGYVLIQLCDNNRDLWQRCTANYK